MSSLCEICGNEKVRGRTHCLYCGQQYHESGKTEHVYTLHRIVNLERGKPRVDIALTKLEREIERAVIDNIGVVTVIHGYGSSGKGGKIRHECRKMLDFYKDRGRVKEIIRGEDFSRKNGATKSLLRRFPQLLKNENLNKNNKGVTLIEV